jgi:Na+/H+-dicarboxylate symporter
LRVGAALATVGAFLLAPRLGRRAGPKALVPLAAATGLSLAVALAFLFVVLSVESG